MKKYRKGTATITECPSALGLLNSDRFSVRRPSEPAVVVWESSGSMPTRLSKAMMAMNITQPHHQARYW